jgi:A/G-specific adenine glycosylase
VYTERAHAREVRRRVSRWYSEHGRDLPWRRTHDPYPVLVSEVMLQQTQVSRVVPAYRAFLMRFPTLGALRRASLGDVLRAWRGLGYNRRARDLHRAARSSNGGLPATVAGLDALPGIGTYTAGAVACFAHGLRVAFADTNIRRVLGRAVLGRVATEREAVAIDRELLPRDAARWHHALMDIGALFCRARAPRCDECPLAVSCRGRGAGADPTRRRQSAFATSDRRIRGWIVTLLSDRDAMTPRAIEAAIDDERVPRILTALERDGLIERRAGKLGLPN